MQSPNQQWKTWRNLNNMLRWLNFLWLTVCLSGQSVTGDVKVERSACCNNNPQDFSARFLLRLSARMMCVISILLPSALFLHLLCQPHELIERPGRIWELWACFTLLLLVNWELIKQTMCRVWWLARSLHGKEFLGSNLTANWGFSVWSVHVLPHAW